MSLFNKLRSACQQHRIIFLLYKTLKYLHQTFKTQYLEAAENTSDDTN